MNALFLFSFFSLAPFRTLRFCYNGYMREISAGILMFRRRGGILEVLLVHPGGPFYANKDLGVWSIPKGLIDEGEDPLAAAQREFEEETGFTASGDFILLKSVKLKSGKVIKAWAFEGDCDPLTIKSNTFTMEWPPHSGSMQEFPEVDRAAWFTVEEAQKSIHPGQSTLIEELRQRKQGSAEAGEHREMP